MTEELLTVDEAAARLKLQPDTVRRMIRAGRLRAQKLGRGWRVPVSALAETLAEAPKTGEASA
jgi:excisionase family DNA binding protein